MSFKLRNEIFQVLTSKSSREGTESSQRKTGKHQKVELFHMCVIISYYPFFAFRNDFFIQNHYNNFYTQKILLFVLEMSHFLSTFILIFFAIQLCEGSTKYFRGVNWADARDNYCSGWVIPSGLLSSDKYTEVQEKSKVIINSFQTNLNTNTIRLPINPPSVLESWWDSYKATIDTSLNSGMQIILGYWEAENQKDGKIDNLYDFWTMWNKVVTTYANNPDVYFEIFNEPFGYSSTEWTNIAAQFIGKFQNIILTNRIIVSGTGYNDNLVPVGADSRLNGCLLSLHIYAFWNTKYITQEQWESDFQKRVGNYSSRAIVSEYGVPMTTGLNYTGPINNNNNIAFMYGIPNQIRTYSMGAVYWPGFRSGDSYTIQEQQTTNGSLYTTNESGKTRIQYAWGF
jgi:endoglucanase